MEFVVAGVVKEAGQEWNVGNGPEAMEIGAVLKRLWSPLASLLSVSSPFVYIAVTCLAFCLL